MSNRILKYVLIIVFLIGAGFAWYRINQVKEQKEELIKNKAFHHVVEYEKEYILFRPNNFPAYAKDKFGNQISALQWYILNTTSEGNSITPVVIKEDNITGYSPDKLQIWETQGLLKTEEISCTCSGLEKQFAGIKSVTLALFGPKNIQPVQVWSYTTIILQ